MGYDRAAPKTRVNMTLNDDLVRQARGFTPNLSETVEGLLADFLARAEERQNDVKAQARKLCAVLNDFVAEHGLPSDEYVEY